MVRAQDIVWIFGTARSGTTWLGSMMGDLPGGRWWREPLVGRLFADFLEHYVSRSEGREGIVMAEAHKRAWLNNVRSFVLDGAEARFPGGGVLVVQEPNGSMGAPILAEALPESRVILLVRDPRDVVASALDRHRRGGESHRRASARKGREKGAPEDRPNLSARKQAKRYMRNVGASRAAHDAHEGPKTLIRYEDLRADTLGTMRRVYAQLGISAGEGDLARTVEEHSWENIPEEKKGQGKFYRKAALGGWREDLTPRQAKIVEEITAPVLAEFYGAEKP